MSGWEEERISGDGHRPGRGKFKMQPKKIFCKWKEYVKEELKIDVDFYALKHLNLDETSNQLNAEAAAKMAEHTSTVITLKHYLVNEEQREMEKLKRSQMPPDEIGLRRYPLIKIEVSVKKIIEYVEEGGRVKELKFFFSYFILEILEQKKKGVYVTPIYGQNSKI